jgi:hypothetical protein
MKKVEIKMVIGAVIGFAMWLIANLVFVHSVINMTESAMWASLCAWGIAEVPLLIMLMGAGIAIPAFIWKQELDCKLTPGIWVEAELVEE